LRTSGYKWQLSEEEKQDIMLEWIRQVSKTAAMIAKEAIKK
jgi:hypothetical protein